MQASLSTYGSISIIALHPSAPKNLPIVATMYFYSNNIFTIAFYWYDNSSTIRNK